MSNKKDLNFYKKLDYNIIIEPRIEDDEKWYMAYARELGKYSCYGLGSTPEEAITQFREEKNNFLEYLLENNMDIPLPEERKNDYSGQLTIRLPKYLHALLAEQAKEEGVSLNTYIISKLSMAAGEQEREAGIFHQIKKMDYKLDAILRRPQKIAYNNPDYYPSGIVDNSFRFFQITDKKDKQKTPSKTSVI